MANDAVDRFFRLRERYLTELERIREEGDTVLEKLRQDRKLTLHEVAQLEGLREVRRLNLDHYVHGRRADKGARESGALGL